VTLALGFVTLTPSSFARATISILFLDETAWEILYPVSPSIKVLGDANILCGVDLVVHEEEVNVTGVVNEESLVTGGHHVAGLLVRSETNLQTRSAGGLDLKSEARRGLEGLLFSLNFSPQHQSHLVLPRTDGITICPLNRLRTRLSIPFGFLQLASRHL
jgi:hypothetical protein